MHKQTYKDSPYILYQYSTKPPELKHPDFTLQLTTKGIIRLATQSKEYDSSKELFNIITYWCNSGVDNADILIGLEISNAISEVMLYCGWILLDFMSTPYFDFINTSFEYYKVNVYFYKNPVSNKYLIPHRVNYEKGYEYVNKLEELGSEAEHTFPIIFSKCDDNYFTILDFKDNGFFELQIPAQVALLSDNKMKVESTYRIICNLLYHSGYSIMQNGIKFLLISKVSPKGNLIYV